jgi:Protein of unknown function DUF262
MSIVPRGMSVQEAYREYKDGNFIVNRRYQRKLVWSLDEKRKLVDSILHNYPIPLILFATLTEFDGAKKYEILDGMQRLNAIFAFIENKFDTDEKYFDVQQLSRAKQASEQGEFIATIEAGRLLSAELCANFLDYQLAITEYPGANPKSVNDVFGRINAYGRQLSEQEKRQAGVITPFADIVKTLASELRGDASAIILDLSKMPQISIDADITRLGYGVNADDTFWVKQSILRKEQLRDSEDEQFIADLIISIITKSPFAFSGRNLDEIYDQQNKKSQEINESLRLYGAEKLKNNFLGVFSTLKAVVENFDDSTYALRKIVHPSGGSNPIKTAFYAIFMAFFELLIEDKKVPASPEKIMISLKDLHKKLNTAAGQIKSESREKNIDLTKGLIQKFFAKKSPETESFAIASTLKLENALRRSKIETTIYECKQGILRLDKKRTIDENLLDKLVHTICAIANLGPESSGGIFIGVADNQDDAKKIKDIDLMEPKKLGDRVCVGIDREAKVLSLSLDSYQKKIVEHISNSKLSEPLKSSVLSSIDCISYKDLSIVCLWVPSQVACSHVDNKIYVRSGSDTINVTQVDKITAIINSFSTNRR